MMVIVMDYFFYRYWYGLIILVPAFFYFKRVGREKMEEDKKNKIREQFKELLLLSETGQKAGLSVDNSIIDSMDDLKVLYGNYQD